MESKRLLLIDLDDERRHTRIEILRRSGYQVDVRTNFIAAEALRDEGEYDLVVLAIYQRHGEALGYAARLRDAHQDLPILLLTDQGVYVAVDPQRNKLETGDPKALLQEIAQMLAGSVHLREIPRTVNE